MTLHQIK